MAVVEGWLLREVPLYSHLFHMYMKKTYLVGPEKLNILDNTVSSLLALISREYMHTTGLYMQGAPEH